MTTQTTDELRRTGYETWQSLAPSWARRRPFIEQTTASVREWISAELRPEPGQTILELAAGVGDTGFDAAERVAPGGRLITTDLTPAMVDEARRRAAERGIRNVEFRVADAERLDLGDDCVDGAICRYGYMLMVDPAAAIAETRRVLRPGGRLALAVWGPPDRNPFFAALGMTLVQRGHMPPPDPDGPGIFSMASPERTRALLEGAGFDDVRLEDVPVSFTFGDIDDYLGFVFDTAGPIAAVLRGLTTEEQAALHGRLEEAFAPFRTDGGHEVPGQALCAVGTA